MADPQLLDVLTREGVLIDISVRYWRASKKLRPEDLGLDADNITEALISLGHKRLVPREALQPFALIEGRAHGLIEAATFPFLGGLGHFLPNTKLGEVTSKLGDLESEFGRAREDFFRRYGDLRIAAAREWYEAARKLVNDPERLVTTIEAAFPPPERMDRYFGFATTLFQIRAPEGFQVDPVTLGDQEAIVRAREAAAVEASRTIHKGVENFVVDCVATLREQAATLCDEMLESMREGKTEAVHQKTLNRLVKFVDRFKELNFAGDAEMDNILERARSELLSKTAEEYRDDAFAQAKLRGGLEGLRDTARDLARQDSAEIVARFGRLGARKFHLAA